MFVGGYVIYDVADNTVKLVLCFCCGCQIGSIGDDNSDGTIVSVETKCRQVFTSHVTWLDHDEQSVPDSKSNPMFPTINCTLPMPEESEFLDGSTVSEAGLL